MVLTITVVGNGQGTNTPNPTAGAGHPIISPNDLAQYIGQSVTGLLNPDGTITINSNVMPSQQLTSMPATIHNGGPPITANTTTPSPSGYTSQVTNSSNSSINMQPIMSEPHNTNTNNNIQSQNTTTSTITTQKKTGQKRLTAKQKLAQQQKNQQQQQQQQPVQQNPDLKPNFMTTQQLDQQQQISQQPQIVATVQLPNGQIGQLIAPSGGQFWSPSAINLQQLSMAVAAATGTMPQTMSIPVSGTSSGQQQLQQQSNQNNNHQHHHNQQQQQQQQSSEQLVLGTQQQQSLNSSNNNNNNTNNNSNSNQQQQVMTTMQLANNPVNQLIGRQGQNQIWSAGPISLSQLSSLAQQGVVQLSPVQSITTTGPNGQRVVEMIPQAAIQGLLNQNGQPVQAIPLVSGGQFVAQDPNDPNKWQIIQPAQINSSSSGQSQQIQQSQQQLQLQQHQQSNTIQNSASSETANSSQSTTVGSSNSTSGTSRNVNTITYNPFVNSNNNNNNISNSNSNTNTNSNSNNNNNTTTTTTTAQSAVLSDTSHSIQPQRKLKRLACTCPNCRDGDNSRTGGNGDKKKQHICHFPECNKVYGKTSHLRAHLRWHSGERPYVCSWSFCGKKFTRSDELQRHRRTHTGEKRFQCSECLKRFMRSDHLSKHLKTHLSMKKSVNQQQQQQQQQIVNNMPM